MAYCTIKAHHKRRIGAFLTDSRHNKNYFLLQIGYNFTLLRIDMAKRCVLN